MTIEAMKQALEALEFDGFTPKDLTHRSLHAKAITAIKQALAQEKALQALHDENERLGLYKDAYGQPEPEPVVNYCHECLTYNGHQEECSHYTSPPKREWQGLTGDEIDYIADEYATLQGAIGAIEAKLKEKNS